MIIKWVSKEKKEYTMLIYCTMLIYWKKYVERKDSVSAGAVAVDTDANICKNEHVTVKLSEAYPSRLHFKMNWLFEIWTR